ncbi:hypothetical protein DFJ73DRAFT_564685 [Zopfochytrium polystomum]|nr:hypothetical protein DFJ73DRAFT_564685 [Zopfochytrium polystomum]
MMTSPQPPPKSTPKSAWSDAALAAAEVAFPGAAQPPTPDAVAQAIRSLTPARRTAVAVGVALRFRRDQPDRVRELARAMLVTPTLCSTIPIIRAVTATEEPQEKEKKPAPPAAGSGGPPTVARVSVDDDDAAEWDVVPTEEDIKLLVSQTSACKNLHHHLFALTLATVLCDEEILTKISEHPSSTLSHIAKRSLKVVRKSKSKAKKSASSHIATAPPSVASVAPVASLASVDAKKSNELDTFASFAQKVQSPPEGKTRTQIWNEEGQVTSLCYVSFSFFY